MKQFRPGYLKTYILLKKNCGAFGVLGITRLLELFARVLIPGDRKQIRVQFCCENFLLRHLLTLKHSHHFNVCLEFHDPFHLCSDDFTLIILDCLPVTISYSFFSSYCISTGILRSKRAVHETNCNRRFFKGFWSINVSPMTY